MKPFGIIGEKRIPGFDGAELFRGFERLSSALEEVFGEGDAGMPGREKEPPSTNKKLAAKTRCRRRQIMLKLQYYHAWSWPAAQAQAPDEAEKSGFNAAKELGTVEAWNALLGQLTRPGFHADLARAYVKKLAGPARRRRQPPQRCRGRRNFGTACAGVALRGQAGKFKSEQSDKAGEDPLRQQVRCDAHHPMDRLQGRAKGVRRAAAGRGDDRRRRSSRIPGSRPIRKAAAGSCSCPATAYRSRGCCPEDQLRASPKEGLRRAEASPATWARKKKSETAIEGDRRAPRESGVRRDRE